MKLAIIGAGKMGSAIMIGALKAKILNAEDIGVYDVVAAATQALHDEYGVAVLQPDDFTNYERALLAVKPQYFADVAPQIAGKFQAYLSIMAGTSAPTISETVKSERVIRLMPNLGAAVGQSATALAPLAKATTEDIAFAKDVFGSIGKVYSLPENLIDAFTGLAGSGPAFVALFAEAMADGGVRMGLPRDIAQDAARQVLLATATMLENKHPAQLKDEVSSPAGTTIAGVRVLEQNAFRFAVMQAVEDAAKRGQELG